MIIFQTVTVSCGCTIVLVPRPKTCFADIYYLLHCGVQGLVTRRKNVFWGKRIEGAIYSALSISWDYDIVCVCVTLISFVIELFIGFVKIS